MKAILFPTDFSTMSVAAGRVAREAAHQAGAELHVIHVVPPVTEPFDSGQKLAAAAAALADGVSIRTKMLHGRVARQIVEYARMHDIDMIVIGTHGRTGVSHAILGSVAEAVIRLAPCLVLTVPAATAVAAPGTTSDVSESHRRCLLCREALPGEENVCEACRTRVRAEALTGGPAQRPVRT